MVSHKLKVITLTTLALILTLTFMFPQISSEKDFKSSGASSENSNYFAAASDLTLENVKTWYWPVSQLETSSVARGDVDGDGKAEIITGGTFLEPAKHILTAQLCVWDGATLALKNVKSWIGTDDTRILSIALGDVDGDRKAEIITGGYCGSYVIPPFTSKPVAQLCVWDGATLALKNVKTWDWGQGTYVACVALGDADGDSKAEIVTGGYFYDGSRSIAQLCVWDGATLALKNVKSWYWNNNTFILSVALGNIDADGAAEIVTGGNFYDGSRSIAQLCVWDGATLALKNVKTWYWTDNTYVACVALGDADGDSKAEIVTGGYFYDGSRSIAQLCVWDGATLALKNVKTWYWTDNTYVACVALGDADGDSKAEIVTGGYFYDGSRSIAQLCVWDGATLALKNVKTWYWTDDTSIRSIALGNVDSDSNIEIVTAGEYFNSIRTLSQLCVWSVSF